MAGIVFGVFFVANMFIYGQMLRLSVTICNRDLNFNPPVREVGKGEAFGISGVIMLLHLVVMATVYQIIRQRNDPVGFFIMSPTSFKAHGYSAIVSLFTDALVLAGFFRQKISCGFWINLIAIASTLLITIGVGYAVYLVVPGARDIFN